jgi:trans-aconitate 2-methyltransferase
MTTRDQASAGSTDWDSQAYHRVSDPQVAWGRVVLDRLDLAGSERVIDAGCGTGRLTRELSARLPDGELVALDASPQMLEVARAQLADCRPPIRFVQALLPAIPFAGWADVVFSTATFHWVRNHPALFRNIHRALKSGGVLHAQCGGGQNLAAARAPAEAVMRLARFAKWFADWEPIWEFADHRVTADRLAFAGFTDIDTSLEAAPVTFENEEAYRAFVSTVVFRLHLAKLPEELRPVFLDEIVMRLPKTAARFKLDYWRLNLSARKPR